MFFRGPKGRGGSPLSDKSLCPCSAICLRLFFSLRCEKNLKPSTFTKCKTNSLRSLIFVEHHFWTHFFVFLKTNNGRLPCGCAKNPSQFFFRRFLLMRIRDCSPVVMQVAVILDVDERMGWYEMDPTTLPVVNRAQNLHLKQPPKN